MNIFTNFTEYNRNLHYNQCSKCRINSGCVTTFIRKAGETDLTPLKFCILCAPHLHTYGDTPTEQTPLNTKTQKNNHLGEYYVLSEHIHVDTLQATYKGCGNGTIVIEKATGLIAEMKYSDDTMYYDSHGEIRWQDDKRICLTCYFANSCAWLIQH